MQQALQLVETAALDSTDVEVRTILWPAHTLHTFNSCKHAAARLMGCITLHHVGLQHSRMQREGSLCLCIQDRQC